MTKTGNSSEAEISFSKKIYFLILNFSIIWIILIIAAPLLFNFGGIFKIPSEYLYLFYSKTCHQFESRSFFLYGVPLAVCSRCFMIYAGFLTGVIVYPFKYNYDNISVPGLSLLFIAVILISADVLLDMTGIFHNTFLTRSVTGFIIGIVLPIYLIPGIVRFSNEVFSFLKNKYIKLN